MFKNSITNIIIIVISIYIISNLALVATGSSDIPNTRTDGAIRLTLPPSGKSDQNPAFGPVQSRYIVFTRFSNGYNVGPAGLFLLNLITEKVTRLTPIEDQDNVNLPGSVWIIKMGEGRIIFASDRAEANDLWRISPNGSNFKRITRHIERSIYMEPSWSPDGRWIVFETSKPGNSDDGRVSTIWKVRSNGTGLTRLTGTSGLDDRQPNWSPKGDKILFQRRILPNGPWGIYTIDPNGNNLKRVTRSLSDDSDASWSQDGKFIVYSSDYGDIFKPNIFIIPTNGGTPIRVTNSTNADSAPSWSPINCWIAFESHESDDKPAALWRIAAPPSIGCKKGDDN